MRFVSLPTLPTLPTLPALPALVGKAEGMVEIEGSTDGIAEGMVEGSTDGIEEGSTDGEEEGMVEGLLDGGSVAAAGHTSTEGPSNAVYNVAKRK